MEREPETPPVEHTGSFALTDISDDTAASVSTPCIATNEGATRYGIIGGVRGRRLHKAGLLAVGLLAVTLIITVASHTMLHWSHPGSIAANDEEVQLLGKGGNPCEIDGKMTDGKDCSPPDGKLADQMAKRIKNCSKAGDDCSETKCCAAKGMQCYVKNKRYAACKGECIPGAPDPNDEEPEPWDCTRLGERTEGKAADPDVKQTLRKWVKEKCSLPGHDCSESRCCAWGASQCFEKAAGKWASCKESCFPGAPDLSDVKPNVWSCKKLGYKTPGTPLKPPAHVKLPQWIKDSCSTPGEDCSRTKCCAWEGMQCYRKNKHWASCKADCVAGPDLLDVKPNVWTCEPLGPRTPGVGNPPPAQIKVAKWVHSFCGTSYGDCSKSMCCQDPGLRCYQKNEGFAKCRPSCEPGPDPTDVDPEPWTCKALGPRTPGAVPVVPIWDMKPAKWVKSTCSKPGTDCTHTKCCAQEGMRCYKKADGWATCRSECFAGPDPADADSHWWDCEPLGSRTPGKAPQISLWNWKTPDWVARKCSHGGNCLKQGCCAGAGMQCYKKNDGWAVCKNECFAGAPDFTDIENTHWSCDKIGGRTPGKPTLPSERAFTLPSWLHTTCSAQGADCSKTKCCIQKGMQCYQKHTYWGLCKASCNHDDEDGPWSCKKLGPRTPKPWGKPSLFCFSVVRSFGYEVDIMRTQIREGAGIFACDDVALACSDNLVLGDGIKVIRFNMAAVGISKDGTAGNAQLFINVWQAMKRVKAVNEADWTIKVDPDAVIVPHRLRQHLSPHMGVNVYFKNCGAYQGPDWPMMFGALEVFSKGAIQAYYAGETRCQGELPWQSWGEDVYMSKCMDHLGIGAVVDLGLVFDGVCRGYTNCGDLSAAAFHPFKSANGWLGCWKQAKR